jgi:hypothetical protein
MAFDLSSTATTKGLISSLLRSLFSGRITVFRNQEVPLFKVERKVVAEVVAKTTIVDMSEAAKRRAKRELFYEHSSHLKPEPRQWVMVADTGCLALRNIDHLIPSDASGPHAPPQVDFYWARAGKDEISNPAATPGLWAVRGEHLPLVLERWKEAWNGELEPAEASMDEEIWTRVVRELPLRKRAFEKGEVVAPRIGAVDWEAVSNAAFVTVPDWPEKEAWKFLQALYFGTYLGDETGLMLNILEA